MDLSLERAAFPVNLDRTRWLFFDHSATWLLTQRYGRFFIPQLFTGERREIEPAKDGQEAKTVADFKLTSMEGLVFFVWVGLQREAKEAGEVALTEEQIASYITPSTVNDIFLAAVYAVAGATRTPVQEGKGEAAAATARPAAPKGKAAKGPGPAKVTTMKKRSASPTRSSGGRRRSSGR